MKKPLEGHTLLVTRSADDFAATSTWIKQFGGKAISCPMISFRTPQDTTKLDQSIQSIHQYDWIFFTSSNGVDFFCNRLKEHGIHPSTLQQTQVGIIGEKTVRSAEAYGIQYNFIPTKADATTFFNEFSAQYDSKDKTFLIPTSQIAHDILPKQLTEQGGSVNQIVAYETIHTQEFEPDISTLLTQDKTYWVLFTSSSTVDAFFTCLSKIQKLNASLCFASIGPSTSKTIRQHGYEPTVEAVEHNMDGLLNAVITEIQSHEE